MEIITLTIPTSNLKAFVISFEPLPCSGCWNLMSHSYSKRLSMFSGLCSDFKNQKHSVWIPNICLLLCFMVYFCQEKVHFDRSIRNVLPPSSLIPRLSPPVSEKRRFLCFFLSFFLVNLQKKKKTYLPSFNCILRVNHGLLSHSVYPNLWCCCSF